MKPADVRAKLTFYALCAVLVLLSIGSIYAFWWGTQELQAQKDRGLKKQLALQDEQQRTEQLIQLNRRYNDAKSRIADINTALPHSAEQAEMLLAVKEAANQSGVILPSIQFTGSAQLTNPQLNQATPAKGLYILPISLKLSGTYDQLQKFLGRLENLSRYNSVTSLSLSKLNADPNKLDISLSVNAYLKP